MINRFAQQKNVLETTTLQTYGKAVTHDDLKGSLLEYKIKLSLRRGQLKFYMALIKQVQHLKILSSSKLY